VHLVGEPVEVGGGAAHLGADLEQLGLAGGAGGRERVALGGGVGQRRLQGRQGEQRVGPDGGGDPCAAFAGDPRGGGPLAGGTFLPGLAAQRLGPPGTSAQGTPPRGGPTRSTRWRTWS
jgi:hypothetical protein